MQVSIRSDLQQYSDILRSIPIDLPVARLELGLAGVRPGTGNRG